MSLNGETIFYERRWRVSFWCSINESAVVWQNEERLPLPVGTLSVDSWPYLVITSHFRNVAGKPEKQDQRFQATMNSSVDEVKDKLNRLHFFKEILTMFVVWRITVLQFTKETWKSNWFDPQISLIEFDLVHWNINNTGEELLFTQCIPSCMR